MVQTETCASTTLKDGPGLKLGNSDQQALHIVLWAAANKCLGGNRATYFIIVDDLYTAYQMSDWSMSFLPLSSVYQKNEQKIPGLEKEGEKTHPTEMHIPLAGLEPTFPH
jgi:hypothetical protein